MKIISGNYKMTEIVIIIILILFLILLGKFRERLHDQFIPNRSHVRLYSDFNQKGDLFELNAPAYSKRVLKINPRSMDLKLTKLGIPAYDAVRKIEIWEMNDNMPNASLATDFYNAYQMPEYLYKANPAQFKKVITVLPGQHIVTDFPDPVYKIMLIAVL